MKKTSIFISFIIIICVVSVVSYYGYGRYEKTLDHTGKAQAGIEVTMKNEKIRTQAGKEELYLENFKEGNYTIKNPYIVQDPYEKAPLTALIMFNTDEAAKISITVKGKTEQTDIKHTFKEFEKTHTIPVLGLLSDTNNQIIIAAETEDGDISSSTIHIQTKNYLNISAMYDIKTLDQKSIDIGDSELTFVVPSTKYAYAFDENGDIRWYSSNYNSHVFTELENGHYLFLTKESNGADTYNVLVEMDLMGKYYHIYDFNMANAVKEGDSEENRATESTMIHHDAVELPNHNLLLTVNDHSDYVEDTMIEVNRETGDIEKVIDLKEILPASFYENYSATDEKKDWFHQNSTFYDETDDSIIISGRNQDTVMKLDYKTEQIKWILAADENWPRSVAKPYLLKATNDVKFNGARLTAILIPDQDNNPETKDLLLYDNNVAVSRGDKDVSKKYSRAAQYTESMKKTKQ